MNYKLAKQLKDAGFEQKGEGKTLIKKTRNVGISTLMVDNSAYAPTLEELIEACDSNGHLFLNLYHKSSKEWEASAEKNAAIHAPNRVKGIEKVEDYKETIGIGDTPKKAMTKLYLKLNKK